MCGWRLGCCHRQSRSRQSRSHRGLTVRVLSFALLLTSITNASPAYLAPYFQFFPACSSFNSCVSLQGGWLFLLDLTLRPCTLFRYRMGLLGGIHPADRACMYVSQYRTYPVGTVFVAHLSIHVPIHASISHSRTPASLSLHSY